MRRNLYCSLAISILFVSFAQGQRVGEPAPDFQATDSNGPDAQLSRLRGRVAVPSNMLIRTSFLMGTRIRGVGAQR